MQQRDASPTRRSIGLTSAVVNWLGDDFRSPIVDGRPLDWGCWEKRLAEFAWPWGLPKYDYATVIAFFIQYSYKHNYGRFELQLLLEHLFNSSGQVRTQFFQQIWPMIQVLKLENLPLWPRLHSALATGQRWVKVINQNPKHFDLVHDNAARDPLSNPGAAYPRLLINRLTFVY